MSCWLVVMSHDNFRYTRDVLKFGLQGLPQRARLALQRMEKGDRVVYYIIGLQKFGATAVITGDYYQDSTKVWPDEKGSWPSRRTSKPGTVLQDADFVDARTLVPRLSFVKNKRKWGCFFQGSIRRIPDEDFRLVEAELRKASVRAPSR